MDWNIRRIASRTLEAWKQLLREQQETRRAPEASTPAAADAQPVLRRTVLAGGSFEGAPGRDRFGAAEDLRRRLQGSFDERTGEGQLTAAESKEALTEAKSAANQGSNALSVVPLQGEASRTQAIGSSSSRSIGGIAGVAAGLFGLAQHSKNFDVRNVPDLALDAGNTVVGSSQSVAAAREAKALAASAPVDEAANAAGKVGTIARFGGVITGVLAGGLEVFKGVKEDDKVKVAQGGVTIAGTVAGFAAAGAIGGPAGVAVGAGIGLATFGVRWGIGKLFGD